MIKDLLLLSKDTPIAKIIGGGIQPLLPWRLPLFLRRTGDVETWLASRAIDGHRTNSRLLKKALRLENRDDITAVLSVNGVTITDNYWVKPLDDTGTGYSDVRYTANRFDSLALKGDVNSFNQPPGRTPELTNTGSFEKCWRLIDGAWWMVKAGKPEELFSELAICRIGQRLGFPIAEYEPEGEYIRSRDFTGNAGVDFEPAVGIIGDTADYIKIYEALKAHGGHVAGRYLQMCYLDALVLNMDRHENNFGVLCDSDTGKVLSLAPFFDHNIAFVSNGYPQPSGFENDLLIGDFVELMRYSGETMSVHEFTRTEVNRLMRDIPWKLPVHSSVTSPERFAAEYMLKRQARLKELCCEMMRFEPAPSGNRGAW